MSAKLSFVVLLALAFVGATRGFRMPSMAIYKDATADGSFKNPFKNPFKTLSSAKIATASSGSHYGPFKALMSSATTAEASSGSASSLYAAPNTGGRLDSGPIIAGKRRISRISALKNKFVDGAMERGVFEAHLVNMVTTAENAIASVDRECAKAYESHLFTAMMNVHIALDILVVRCTGEDEEYFKSVDANDILYGAGSRQFKKELITLKKFTLVGVSENTDGSVCKEEFHPYDMWNALKHRGCADVTVSRSGDKKLTMTVGAVTFDHKDILKFFRKAVEVVQMFSE